MLDKELFENLLVGGWYYERTLKALSADIQHMDIPHYGEIASIREATLMEHVGLTAQQVAGQKAREQMSAEQMRALKDLAIDALNTAARKLHKRIDDYKQQIEDEQTERETIYAP